MMIDWKWKSGEWESLDEFIDFLHDHEEPFIRDPAPEMETPRSCASCHRWMWFKNGSGACRKYSITLSSQTKAELNVCPNWIE